MYVFCYEVEHDTWRNIKENEEFVVNSFDESFGELMEPLARDLPYQTSEIAAAGISETLSRFVKSPRIKEAYGWIEYKMIKYVNFSDKMVWIF